MLTFAILAFRQVIKKIFDFIVHFLASSHSDYIMRYFNFVHKGGRTSSIGHSKKVAGMRKSSQGYRAER
jgi:hypothetical protein